MLCTSAKTPSMKIGSAHVYGRVTGFKKYLDSANSIRFEVEDMVKGRMIYNSMLKSDGSFSIDIPLLYTQRIDLDYNDNLINILVSPGKQLRLNFNASDPQHMETFGGGSGPENSDLAQYQTALDKQWHLWYGKGKYARYKQLNRAQTGCIPAQYKQYVFERYNKEHAFTDRYINTHKSASPLFVRWAKNELKYECASVLLDYIWAHNANYQPAIPDTGYFDFIKQFELSNKDALITPYYKRYIDEYSQYLIYKNLGKEYETERLIGLYKQQPPLMRDIVLSELAYGLIQAKQLDKFAQLKKELNASIGSPMFKGQMLEFYQQALFASINAKLPQDAIISKVPVTEADSLFNKIVAKYPNKVVYFDFWATWCGPCRAEMPNSKALQANLKGKDVFFVYLGVQSDEKTWKSQIAEMGISGEHYLLKNNEFNTLSAKFNISGIPHYVLVNRKGHIVDGDAKRPGEPALKKEIDKLLAEN